jgi:hypothetical protein
VNSVFDKLPFYSWIFVYIGRKARFRVARISVHTQKIGNPHKIKNLYKQEIEISNASCLCSNIPTAPVCGVYVSQLMQYFRACGCYQDFRDRGLLLTRKLLYQGFLLVKLRLSLPVFYGHHHDLVDSYGISVSYLTMDMFDLS